MAPLTDHLASPDCQPPAAAPATFVITTLAEYQTVFWGPAGEELRRRGFGVVFLAFDDRSAEMLERRGLETWNMMALQRGRTVDTSEAGLAAALSRLGMTGSNLWFSHERAFFHLYDGAALRAKFLETLAVVEDVFGRLVESGRRLLLVQELGGFLSVIACFHVARKHGIDNWFLEPAFFRGRLFFLRNSFKALTIDSRTPVQVDAELRQYLDATLAARTIVVPKKDSHHYNPALKKILNWRNLRRLVEKLADKYLHGKRQEFGYIGTHVGVHLQMLWTSARLSRRYTPLAQLGRFVYYPLHVPADMALTLRAPHCLDQLAIIDYLARIVPDGCRLAIKEHPAMIGAIDGRRLEGLLDRYDTLALLPPSTNNYEVLTRAEVVVSVNSKSGAEALLVGKPVIVLGDSFYRSSPLVTAVQALEDLPTVLAGASHGSPPKPDTVAAFFSQVWQHSLPGELYVEAPDNVTVFTQSLIQATCVPDSAAVT